MPEIRLWVETARFRGTARAAGRPDGGGGIGGFAEVNGMEGMVGIWNYIAGEGLHFPCFEVGGVWFVMLGTGYFLERTGLRNTWETGLEMLAVVGVSLLCSYFRNNTLLSKDSFGLTSIL